MRLSNTSKSSFLRCLGQKMQHLLYTKWLALCEYYQNLIKNIQNRTSKGVQVFQFSLAMDVHKRYFHRSMSWEAVASSTLNYFYVLGPRKCICYFRGSLDNWNDSRIRGYDRGRASRELNLHSLEKKRLRGYKTV